jgi:hypothetical protein
MRRESSRIMKMTVDKVRASFRSTGLFRNCLPDEVLESIRKPLVTLGITAEQLLIAEARKPEPLYMLRKIWRSEPGKWSFGYCSCIAEVASLILGSAIPASNYQRFRCKKTEKARFVRKLPEKIKKHFVLKWDDRCFDPLKGADCSWERGQYKDLGFDYAGFLNPTDRTLIRYPSVNALLLLAWVIRERGRPDEAQNGASFIRDIQAYWKTESHRPSLKEELKRTLEDLENSSSVTKGCIVTSGL